MIELTGNQQANSAVVDAHVDIALHHLFSACRFSSKLAQLERENAGKSFGSFWEEILRCSLGVAAMTVMFLDRYADELCPDGCGAPEAGHEATEWQALSIGTDGILKKYSNALESRVGRPLDLANAAVKNIDALIKLRNEAVRLLCADRQDAPEVYDNLSEVLQHKFKLSGFLPGEPALPRAWATYSFSAWAIRSAVEFIAYFYAEAGLPSPIEKFKPQLSRLSGYMF